MFMYTSIMVALRDARHDEAPLNAAIRLARTSAARLHLVHVRTKRPADGDIDIEHSELLKAVDRASEEVEESVSFELIEATDTRSSKHDIAHHLIEYANAHGIDLIIMGTHARSVVGRRILGSVADGLIRALELPILLIPRAAGSQTDPLRFRRILVALDGTAQSERIVTDAAQLASLAGGSIVLMHVLQPKLLRQRDRFGRSAASLPDDDVMLRGDRSEDYLDQIAQTLNEQGIAATTSTFLGDNVAQLIKDEADAESADVIALVTRGRLPILGFSGQGVFDDLIAGARCAVLVRRQQALSEHATA
jgi:nucleotide-binding universal stress UspA family protein